MVDSRCEVAVIGGGIVGASVAYHLAKKGLTDVTVLEREADRGLGFSGHGVMHAPATGRLLAEWLVDGRPSLDLTPLRHSRFREGALNQETHVI